MVGSDLWDWVAHLWEDGQRLFLIACSLKPMQTMVFPRRKIIAIVTAHHKIILHYIEREILLPSTFYGNKSK